MDFTLKPSGPGRGGEETTAPHEGFNKLQTLTYHQLIGLIVLVAHSLSRPATDSFGVIFAAV